VVEGVAMASRAYMLLELTDVDPDRVVEDLRRQSGVMMAEPLDGPPDIIMMVEAPDRQKLAELTIKAIGSVESVAKGIRVLPSRGH
jgi:hypothetical protein